jgi:polyisoprenoid-binding protein YceI
MTTAPLEPGTWTIDAAHTLVEFSVRHMTVARVTGRFAAVSGEVKVPDGDPLAATVTVSIDVSSVASGHPKRDELIRSADFLDAATFPVITFTSGPAEDDGDGNWKIPGVLTIKGVSRDLPPRRDQGRVLRNDDDQPQGLRRVVRRAARHRRRGGVRHGDDQP